MSKKTKAKVKELQSTVDRLVSLCESYQRQLAAARADCDTIISQNNTVGIGGIQIRLTGHDHVIRRLNKEVKALEVKIRRIESEQEHLADDSEPTNGRFGRRNNNQCDFEVVRDIATVILGLEHGQQVDFRIARHENASYFDWVTTAPNTPSGPSEAAHRMRAAYNSVYNQADAKKEAEKVEST